MISHREPGSSESRDDAELHQAEPVRIVVAIGALLLGLVLGTH